MRRGRRRRDAVTDEAVVAPRRDRGFSLVELVVAISIMGIIMVPLLSAVMTNIKGSTSLDAVGQTETVAQNAADRVNRAPKRCDYTQYAQAAAQSVGWSANQVTVTYSHFVPGSSPTVQGTWVSGACIGQTPTDLLVQLVTITVASPAGRTGTVQRTIQVVKSDV